MGRDGSSGGKGAGRMMAGKNIGIPPPAAAGYGFPGAPGAGFGMMPYPQGFYGGQFMQNQQFGGKGPKAPGGEDSGNAKLFIGNLPPDIDDASLYTVFGAYGVVKCVFVMRTGSVSGQACAFVEYGTEFEAQTAINTLHNKYEIRPGEGPISVRKSNSKNSRPSPY